MKITTILGSPRKRGNTAAVLGLFEALIPSPHRVERFDIMDCTVKGCLGCDTCFKTLNEPGCVQQDDASAIFKHLMDSDLIVYTTPVYVWGFSAQMKALMDRHYSLVKWADGQVVKALLKGKRTALLVTCGDTEENNADLVLEAFDREMDYLGCTVAGKYVVPQCTKPSELGDKGEKTARQMHADLLGVQ